MRIATLNARGIQKKEDRETLVMDTNNYNTPILVIPETHIPTEETITDIILNKNKYKLYNANKEGNTNHGIGLLVREELEPAFEKESDRIIKTTIKLKDRRLIVIRAYAPTLDVSEKNPKQREDFYECLNASIEKVSNRDILIIAGDFNAKTGSLWKEYPENMGKFGKGHGNSSGRQLLELCMKHDLVITNTLFQHKLTHRLDCTHEGIYNKKWN